MVEWNNFGVNDYKVTCKLKMGSSTFQKPMVQDINTFCSHKMLKSFGKYFSFFSAFNFQYFPEEWKIYKLLLLNSWMLKPAETKPVQSLQESWIAFVFFYIQHNTCTRYFTENTHKEERERELLNKLCRF